MTEEELKEHQKFVADITKAIEEFKFDPIKVHGQGKKLEDYDWVTETWFESGDYVEYGY